jgi:hypothetical protein
LRVTMETAYFTDRRYGGRNRRNRIIRRQGGSRFARGGRSCLRSSTRPSHTVEGPCETSNRYDEADDAGQVASARPSDPVEGFLRQGSEELESSAAETLLSSLMAHSEQDRLCVARGGCRRTARPTRRSGPPTRGRASSFDKPVGDVTLRTSSTLIRWSRHHRGRRHIDRCIGGTASRAASRLSQTVMTREKRQRSDLPRRSGRRSHRRLNQARSRSFVSPLRNGGTAASA